MAKTYLSTVKYEVKAKYEITGLVEKPDIVGAIFGQSEGLLGEDMDLKQLQQNGKIGRIEISVNKGKGKTYGEIIIPSSLDQVKTSILAATMETVEKVGPCEADVKVVSISDVRQEKRGQITDRAKELLKKMQKFEGVDNDVLVDNIRSEIRTEKAVTYQGMAAGPDVEKSKSIIIVEGRADVLKLLSYGINDAIEMNGSNISPALIQICKDKEVTVLIDGDRGGELNVKKLASLTKVDYVAKAPDGKEVEELTQKEILQGLKRRVQIKEFLSGKNDYNKNNGFENRNSYDNRNGYEHRAPYENRNNYDNKNNGYRNNYAPRPSYGNRDNFQDRRDNQFNRNNSYENRNNYPRNDRFERPSFRDNKFNKNERFETRKSFDKPFKKQEFKPTVVEEKPKEIIGLAKEFEKIKGSLKARFYDAKMKKIKDVKVSEMIDSIEKSKKKINTVAFDGIITKRLLETAETKGIKSVVGVRKSTASSDKVKTYTM